VTEPGAPAARAAAGVGRVEVRGLTWRPFGRRDPVIPGLDLDVPAGQRVLLVGPSGSGKSTLLRALAGVLEVADSGERGGTVGVDGIEPGSRPGQVGLVLQEPGAGVVAATIGRDVAFGLENTALPPGQMPDLVRDALGAVHLDLPVDTPTHALSGGEQQRLALAGALALQPDLLLLDEPTAMLDAVNAASVRAVVGEVVAARGLTTVVVEHRLGPWVDFADRLLVLGDDGHVVADGDPGRVLADHAERLAAQGIWVPGVPDPEPARVPAGTFGAGRLGAHMLAVDAAAVRVERSVRVLDGSTRTTVAVDDQWFQARAAEVHALVGPSGSGKSSLVLALAGLLERQAGDVRVHPDLAPQGQRDPHRWGTLDVARTMAWVPQWASSTIVARTVLDEALATSRALGHVESEAMARARTLLALVGLTHLEQADPRHLSGGEQRRLAMVAAAVHQPAVLLADEPTVGQDRHTWSAVTGLLESLRDAGSAVVVTTHDPGVVGRADAVTTVTRPRQPAPAPAPRRPLVARCGPLALLAGAVLAIPAGVAAPHWRVSLLVLATQVVLAVVGLSAPGSGPPPHGRLRDVAWRMVPGVVGAASVGWSTWLLGSRDLDVAVTAALRVLIIVLPSAVLVRHVDADALGDHLAQRLRLPARPVVAVSAALQRIHTFGDIWTEISRARRIRGIGASARSPRSVLSGLGAVTFGMLVRSLQAAAQLAVAMDGRGFATARRRTWMRPAPWTRADSLLILAACLPWLLAVAG
jgi:energy-coupling factor transport system permease/ATP-binding protein